MRLNLRLTAVYLTLAISAKCLNLAQAEDRPNVSPERAANTAPVIDLGMELRDTANGLVVGEVTAGSLAARGGFKAADLILSCGDTPVSTSQGFERQLMTHAAGERVSVIVLREDLANKLTLTMPQNLLAATLETSAPLSAEGQARAAASGEASIEPDGQPTVASYRGVELPFVDLGWGLENTAAGVLIVEIRKGPLSKGELFAGDIILSIDRHRVESPAAVNYELHRHKAGDIVEFHLLRKDRKAVERVRLPETHQALLLNEAPANVSASASAEGGLTPEEAAAIRALHDEIQELRAQIAELRNLRESETAVNATPDAGTPAVPAAPDSPDTSPPD